MRATVSIAQLLRKHRNENIHTEHVTRLALQLFDHTRSNLGLPASGRRLLWAAARLHDIGYFRDPVHHVRVGAELVRKTPITGFSRADRHLLAAIILLHGRAYEKQLRHPLIKRLPDPERAKALAAFLRIADGLDHGHVQDARLQSIRWTARRMWVTVDVDAYPGNVPWAQAKADLWRARFHQEVTIQLRRSPRRGQGWAGLLEPEDAVPEAARKILSLCYRLIADHRRGVLDTEDMRPLHDLRIAVRRFRTALRFFGARLPGASTDKLNRDLLDLTWQLRRFRDRDAWIEFLDRCDRQRKFRSDPRWPDYLERERNIRKRQLARLRKLMDSAMFNRWIKRAAYFLRAEMPDLLGRRPRQNVAPFAARKLRRIFKRVLSQPRLRDGDARTEIHAYRKLCRRARYYTEFMATLLGEPVDELAARFKDMADILGDLRDAETGLVRLEKSATPAPAVLTTRLWKIREDCWGQYKEARRMLQRGKFKRRVLRHLARIERKGLP